jgi:hypothetical protein
MASQQDFRASYHHDLQAHRLRLLQGRLLLDSFRACRLKSLPPIKGRWLCEDTVILTSAAVTASVHMELQMA